MARVTVEDCLKNINNQFELTLVSAKRARQLARGADAKVPWGNHKSTVVALREVAEELTGTEVLAENDPPPVPQLKVDLSNIEVGTD